MELDLNTIVHRQKLFSSTLNSFCLRKITKYQNVLLKNGIHLSEQSYSNDDTLPIPRSQSFEDHIELVIGQKSATPNALKTFWKIGNRISTLKLFRWIYLIVQRTKAARILQHLDGISDDEIKSVFKAVGREIAVAYEYQLCFLEGDLEIIKLAQHAGSCIVTYLNSKEAHYAPENLLQAILEVKPQSNSNKEVLKTRAICFNNQPVCFTWQLSQVLKQPGLRIVSDHLNEIINEKPCPNLDTKPFVYRENLDETQACIPSVPTETEQCTGVLQDQFEEELKYVLTTTRDTENSNTNSGASWEEESEKTEGKTSSTYDAGSYANAMDREKTKKHRRISALDMDFEKGMMKVTDYSVEASDFSPVGNDTSQFDNGDSTSIEEDLDSECNNIEHDLLDNRNNSTQENSKQIASKETRQSGDLEFEGTENLQQNDKLLIELSECNELGGSVINANTCSKNGGAINDLNIKSSIVTCEKDNSNILRKYGTHTAEDVSGDTVATNTLTYLGAPQTRNSSEPLQDLHDRKDYKPCETNIQKDYKACETDIHINSNDHINGNTYQSHGPKTSNISDDKVTKDCDGSMSELASADKSYNFYGCFTPYGAKCRPKLYGYRGPLHVWNEKERRFTLIYNDMVTVTRKHHQNTRQCSLNAHQMYIPKTVCKH